MSLLIRLASRHPRFVPKATRRWKWTKIHVLDRVLLKRGTVRVSARRTVLETVSAIEKGIENATETEIDFRGEMVQEAVVAQAAEIVGTITHTRVGIGRWQKEWDFKTVVLFSPLHLGWDAARPNILYLV